MTSDVICHHLWRPLVIIGRHIGRLRNLFHPVVAGCLHGGVLIDLLLDSQQLLRLVASLLLIALFASIKASI